MSTCCTFHTPLCLSSQWHALERSEQAKYYEMARKEKELHLQLYPGWSARDNYGTHSKNKKKRKAPGSAGGAGSESDFNMSKPDSGPMTSQLGAAGAIYSNDSGDYHPTTTMPCFCL